MGPASKVIPVGADGLIDEAALDAMLAEGPALVAIQMVNNETGILQPLDRLAPKIREAGSLLLADCAQSASKISAARRRFHRLVGAQAGRAAGRRRVAGQGSRHAGAGRRAGEGLSPRHAGRAERPGLCGGAWPRSPMTWIGWRRCAPAWTRASRPRAGVIIGEESPRLPTIGAVSLPGASSASLLVQFDLAGIAVSAGSACSSGKMKESAVLAAMGVAPDDRRRLPADQLRPAHDRGRGRRLPRRMDAHREPRSGRHDLPRLSGDDAGRRPKWRRRCGPWIEEKFANPHSPSRWGREAAAAIEVARDQVEAGAWPRRRPLCLHLGRDRGAQLGAQGHVRGQPSAASWSRWRPNMPRCSIRPNGWKARASRWSASRSAPTAWSISTWPKRRSTTNRAGRGDAGQQ